MLVLPPAHEDKLQPRPGDYETQDRMRKAKEQPRGVCEGRAMTVGSVDSEKKSLNLYHSYSS